MDKYKKKSLRFSGCGLSKAVRVLEQNESRKSSRSELLSLRRNIKVGDDSLISTPEPAKETIVKVIPKPLSRLEQLKKWRDEKALKKKLEEKKKPPPFVVGKCNSIKPNFTNLSTLNFSKNTSVIKKNTSSALSKGQKDAQQSKTRIPAIPVSRIPSSRPLQVSQESSRIFESRIPSHKPGIQVSQESSRIFESRIPSHKPGIQKMGVKENVPPHVGLKNSKPILNKPIAGVLRKPSANINKKAVGLTAEPCKAPAIERQKVVEMKKNPVVKEFKKDPVVKEVKKNLVRRQSFAPENFKFVPDLPMVDLSIFDGITFSRNTNSIMRTSTPIKSTPRQPSSDKEKCIGTPAESKLCCGTTTESTHKENENINNIKEVAGNKCDKREASLDNSTTNENGVHCINMAKMAVNMENPAKTESCCKDEGEFEAANKVDEIQYASKKETGDRNVTRRTSKLRKKLTLPECIESNVECISDIILPASFSDLRLCSIMEEFETSISEQAETPKTHKNSAFIVRRSPRLARLSKNKTTISENSPISKPSIQDNSASACRTDLSEAFKQLNVNSISLENHLEPRLPTKQKKVSLLYTPEKTPYSLRKSVRGDLISFS